MPARADADICNMALLYAGVNEKIGSLLENSAVAQACNTVYAEIRRQILNEFRWPFAIRRAQLTPYSGTPYDPTVNYAAGAVISYGVNVYRSLLANNLNQQPNSNSSAAWWAQITRDGWAYACPVPPDMLDPISAWNKPYVSQYGVPAVYNFVDPTSFNLRNPRSSQRVPFKIENANDGTDLQVFLTDLDTPILQYVADVSNPSVFPNLFVETFAWHLAAPLAMGLRGDEKKATACTAMAVRTLADAFVVVMREQQEDAEPISEFEAAREGAP